MKYNIFFFSIDYIKNISIPCKSYAHRLCGMTGSVVATRVSQRLVSAYGRVNTCTPVVNLTPRYPLLGMHPSTRGECAATNQAVANIVRQTQRNGRLHLRPRKTHPPPLMDKSKQQLFFSLRKKNQTQSLSKNVDVQFPSKHVYRE